GRARTSSADRFDCARTQGTHPGRDVRVGYRVAPARHQPNWWIPHIPEPKYCRHLWLTARSFAKRNPQFVGWRWNRPRLQSVNISRGSATRGGAAGGTVRAQEDPPRRVGRQAPSPRLVTTG